MAPFAGIRFVADRAVFDYGADGAVGVLDRPAHRHIAGMDDMGMAVADQCPAAQFGVFHLVKRENAVSLVIVGHRLQHRVRLHLHGHVVTHQQTGRTAAP